MRAGPVARMTLHEDLDRWFFPDLSPMAKRGSAFDVYLREMTARGEAVLRQAGWLDEQTGGPDVERVRSSLVPRELPLPSLALLALNESHWCAAAHEALGEMTPALAWYRLGQYGWRGGRLFATAANPPQFEDRDAVRVSSAPGRGLCGSRG